MSIYDINLDELENELWPEEKAILNCLRDNLKNYLTDVDDPDFWTEEVVKKLLLMNEFERVLLAKLWEPLSNEQSPEKA